MIRIWKYKCSRESLKNIKFHGKNVGKLGWVICRASMYILLNNNFGKFGKSNLSRSEPFYSNPNPCFGAIGKAGREVKSSQNLLPNGWKLEHLQLNLLEMFFLIQHQQLKIFLKNKKHIDPVARFFVAVDCNFDWNFTIFQKYKVSNWILKSGIKYGGNFISYENKNHSYSHLHSKTILLVTNSWSIEKNCIKCAKINYFLPLAIQSKSRLSNQVSKNLICLYFFSIWKEKKWISFEFGLKRWARNKDKLDL